MKAKIHPSALVSEGAELAEDVEIGPYAVIGEGITLGAGTKVGAHAALQGLASFGEENQIFPHVVLGFEAQDLKYRGEKTRLVVGSRNVFREFCTVHRGTTTGRAETVIGDENYFMAYTHVAHDCRVGSRTVFANCASLAGHVEVGDHVVLGAFAVVHQFARLGKLAFIGAFTKCRQDALPFCKTDGADAKTYGLNIIGLKRQGFSDDGIDALQKAYRILVQSKLNTTQALERIEAEIPGLPEVREVVDFIRESKRGFHR